MWLSICQHFNCQIKILLAPHRQIDKVLSFHQSDSQKDKIIFLVSLTVLNKSRRYLAQRVIWTVGKLNGNKWAAGTLSEEMGWDKVFGEGVSRIRFEGEIGGSKETADALGG